MYQRASAGGGGSDWYNVILLTTAPGAAITITDGDEEIEATGTGSQQAIAIHDESATYTISVVVNGFTKPGTSVLTGTTSGVIFEREVAFAEVTLTYDDDFRGETGTISDGTTTANYTFPASDNETTIYIPSTGTWNVYCTVSGEQYKSSDIVVTSLSDSYTSDIHVRPNGKTATPTDNIKTWLECAGIKGKFYTTLDEVLADHETLQKLISDENAVDYMVRSKTFAGGGLVPTMTDNTHPSGEAFSYEASTANPRPAYYAFDKNGSTSWVCDNNYISSNPYVGYDFGKQVCIRRVALSTVIGNTKPRIKDFEVQGSNTDKTSGYTTIYSGTFPTTFTDNVPVYFDLNNSDSYRYYRVVLKTVYENNFWVQVSELQFYTASIPEDETAMRYIGKRNYAADTLLADSNPNLVPVMTDNTTPEGECISSGTDTEHEAYHAFDGIPPKVTGTPILDYWTVASSTGWLGYVFDTPKVCKEIKFFPSSSSATRTTTVTAVEGSVDGVNYTPITFSGNVTNVPSGTYGNIILDNDTAYKAYKVSLSSSDSRIIIQTMDFLAKPSSEPQWFDEICDSDYMESVLNVKVPRVSGSSPNITCNDVTSAATYADWKAFDGNSSTAWYYRTVPNNTPTWIAYDFGRNVKIKSFSLECYRDVSDVSDLLFHVQYFDGTDWIDCSDDVMITSTSAHEILKGMIKGSPNAQKYRMYGPKNGQVFFELQFYGREDVDETQIDIYGAAGAAVSYKNGNSWSPLTTLENDGHKQIAKSSLPSGVSQLEMKTDVAKDPDDLTADFTKKVNIFDQLIELWLAPVDDPLYWYGYVDPSLEVCNSANGWSAAFSFVNPTFNTDNLYQGSGNNQTCAVGSKKVKFPKDVSKIVSVTSIPTGSTAAIQANPTKGIPTPNASSGWLKQAIIRDAGTTVGDKKIINLDVSDIKSEGYIVSNSTYNTPYTTYALWSKAPNPASNFFSAPKDTVYYTQGGIDIVVAETDDWGGAIVDLAKIPDGVTLHSTIADDPDDLTAKYSKVYHEPVSGKFYMMPDNVVYWYGYESEDLGFDANALYSTGATSSKQKNQSSLQIDGTGTGTGIQGQAMSLTNVMDLSGFSKFAMVIEPTSGDSHANFQDWTYIVDGILSSVGWAGSSTPKGCYFTPSPTMLSEEGIAVYPASGAEKHEIDIVSGITTGSLAICLLKYGSQTPRHILIKAIYLES